MEILLKKEGIEVNKTNNAGSAPLHGAAYHGHIKVVKLLLKQEGIQINQANYLGNTPISLAAGKRHGKIVDMLLGTDEIRADGWEGWRPNADPA